MKCRCGHGRQWHRHPRSSSHGDRHTMPCWIRLPTTDAAVRRHPLKGNGGVCKCRDWVPVLP